MITRDAVKPAFEELIQQLLATEGSPSLENFAEAMFLFFENYKIDGVDESYPDEDRLLMEYGIFDWQDGKGENFTFNFIRDFVANPEIEMKTGGSQLHLTLYYDKKDFTGIDHLNIVSTDFDSIHDFKESILASDGFLQARSRIILSYDVFMIDC